MPLRVSPWAQLVPLLTIIWNDFIAEAGDISIWSPDVVNVKVKDNTFTGPGGTTSGVAIEPAGATGTSAISRNTISGYGTGVWILSGGPAGGTTEVSGLTISDNPISGCAKGITLGHTSVTSDMTAITITRNTLSSNTVGLSVGNCTYVKADEFVITSNNFLLNTTGLENLNALQVTAECNYWGSADGPGGVGPGSGDLVSANGDSATAERLEIESIHRFQVGNSCLLIAGTRCIFICQRYPCPGCVSRYPIIG
ncbi:hypothetical protein ES708_23368 [subsurface metagenome]